MLYMIGHEFEDTSHNKHHAGIYKLNLGGAYLCFMQTPDATCMADLFCIDRDFFNSEFCLFMNDRK